MSLAGLANETLAIIARGRYVAPSGRDVDIASMVETAKTGTTLYRPDELQALVASLTPCAAAPARVEITDETTAEAGQRLFEEGAARVAALNFASARNPGGGFLGGAKAQEEDLARCSALYPCQLLQPEYYRANRATSSLLYTDHLIYSPDVPFFRDRRLALLERPFPLTIMTSPAPNAGAAKGDDARPAVLRSTLERRAATVLAVARAREHRVLVLGAWGCGVFRNDPREVAAVFAAHLESDLFRGAFDRIVFAIYDRSKTRATLAAFRDRFTRPA